MAISCLFISCKDGEDVLKSNKTDVYAAHIEKAESYAAIQRYDSAYYFFNQAKLAATNERTNDRIVYALIRMSAIQQIESDYSGSEATATEALPYLKNITVSAYPAVLYNNLGLAYKGQSDFDNAVKQFSNSLQHTTDTLNRCIIQNNIAFIRLDQKKYPEAIQLLEPLTHNAVLIKDSLYYAKVLDNLGYAYFKSYNPKAFDLLQQSLKRREKLANDFELVPVYVHLSEYYQQNNPALSKSYAFKAYQSATKVNSVDDRIETLKNFIQATTGDESKKYAIIRINLTDSIGRVRQTAKNQFAKIRYDDAVTREENATLRYQKERMTYYIIIVSSIALILVLLVFIIRYRKRTKHEREKREAAYNAEIKISRRIHDELANDLYNTITYTETHDLSEIEKKETLLRHLDQVYERARDISRENSQVNTGEDFPLQLREMLTEYSSERQKVILHGLTAIAWKDRSDEKKIIIYRVLQELMVNMKKHSQARMAMVQFESDRKFLVIKYSDNGKGANTDQLFSKNGLQNVENRIKAINGTFIFDSEPENGFRVTITCPSEN